MSDMNGKEDVGNVNYKDNGERWRLDHHLVRSRLKCSGKQPRGSLLYKVAGETL